VIVESSKKKEEKKRRSERPGDMQGIVAPRLYILRLGLMPLCGGFEVGVRVEEERGGFQVNGSISGGAEASGSPGVGFGGVFFGKDWGRRGGGGWIMGLA